MLTALRLPAPGASSLGLPFRTPRRPGVLLMIGLGHVVLLLAWATWVTQPKRALPSTPLAVSLVEASRRPQAPAAELALPRRPVALPAAPALPIPLVASDPALPVRAQAEAATTAPANLPTAAPVVQEAPALRVDAPLPAPTAVPQRKRLAASAVQYRVMPPAEVPRTSRRAGESGTVWLRVLVDAEGVPTSVSLQRSSGFARLDEQALWAMRQARFTPHREDGRPVEVEVIAPIEYPPG